jgi:hypothetical protein
MPTAAATASPPASRTGSAPGRRQRTRCTWPLAAARPASPAAARTRASCASLQAEIIAGMGADMRKADPRLFRLRRR